MKEKTLSIDDLIYIAKFYEHDGPDMAIMFNITKANISNYYYRMKRAGRLETYRRMWDEQDVNALERR